MVGCWGKGRLSTIIYRVWMHHPNGGWPWDFWTINSSTWQLDAWKSILVSFWDGDTWQVRAVSFRESKWINALKVPLFDWHDSWFLGNLSHRIHGTNGIFTNMEMRFGWGLMLVLRTNSPRTLVVKESKWSHVRKKQHDLYTVNEILLKFPTSPWEIVYYHHMNPVKSGGYFNVSYSQEITENLRSLRATQQKELRRPRPPVSSRPAEVAMVESKKVELFPPWERWWNREPLNDFWCCQNCHFQFSRSQSIKP